MERKNKMVKVSKNELSRAKKRAEKTAQALGEDLDQQLYTFYEEYSDSKYEDILDQVIASKTKPITGANNSNRSPDNQGETK